MKRSVRTAVLLTLLLTALSLASGGCKRKPQPLPPPPAAKVEPPTATTPAAPTISLSATPATIERGQSATLRWSTANATSVSIDGGVGDVEASGNRTVSPAASTTYRARATGAGGTATAEARITVVEPPAPVPPPPRSLTDAEIFARDVKDIFFDYDKYNIRDDARPVLVSDANVLKERSSIRVLIEGHCDERGSEKYNLALGDRRANSTKEFLVSQGVPADRVETVSLGEERPFAEGHDEAAWAQNRRAHFVMK
jgi:peptidoglycan-associated lipoprotein